MNPSRNSTHDAVSGRAVLSFGSVQVTSARLAVRIVEVAVRTRVAVRRVVFLAALAPTAFFFAVAGGVVEIAVAG